MRSARLLAPVAGFALALGIPLPGWGAPPPARAVEQKNALLDFSYSFPAAAGAIPQVRAILEADLAKTRADLGKEAVRDRREALKQGFPFRPYTSMTKWQVVTDTPGWLSLSAQVYVDTGGAHGNTGFDTLLWDKGARLRRAPIELFTSAAAFKAAVAAPFCAALDRERAKRRGPDFGGGDMFSKCIDPINDATVIVGSADGRRLTRIGFLIGPYAAGPYVEGTYEVTLPVTPALLRVVKPQFRAAFAPGRG